ncbi:MAG: FimV/HubP family polar landmark protein, partial [Candidatus Competibacter sp.]|nr:FimV/HubP family polar landmark protein [Candidatus Competibacter sp.]
MTRKSFRLWLASLLLGPACALALEIGEIQVSSALNQLFDAKIPLPSLAPEELAKVSVKLAAPPLFEEFGIDRAPVLANLVFSIQYDAEGEVYVKIVSTKPIREPSLALLLEFGWPRGKTIREFTIFLDPVQRLAKRPSDRTKTILDAQPGAMSGPAPEPVPEPPPVVVATVPLPVEMSVEPPLPVEKLPPPPPVKTWEPGATYGPVPPGEGLWAIALKLRPDPGISRDQMMQALFRANPQAFSKAGVGGLKTGAMLRIPTLREIADFTGSPVARR